jgi:hypothetical protein
MRGTIFSKRKGGHVEEQSFPNVIQTLDLERRAATLQKRAAQKKVKLRRDVALYLAQQVWSSSSTLEGVLSLLIANSSFTGKEITLTYTQQLLKNVINLEARRSTVNPSQKIHLEQRGTNASRIKPQDPTAADHDVVFCLLKIQQGRTRVRNELEVNMRESERERLARGDAYEREFERRAKKRKQG